MRTVDEEEPLVRNSMPSKIFLYTLMTNKVRGIYLGKLFLRIIAITCLGICN